MWASYVAQYFHDEASHFPQYQAISRAIINILPFVLSEQYL